MTIFIELVIILVLTISLVIFLIEEKKIKDSKIPRGAIQEYWDGKERRQAFRITTALIVKYSVEKKPHIKINGHIEDVSSSGMRLLANEKLMEGTLLLLEFELPKTKNAVFAEGKVVWGKGTFSERDGVGRRVFQTGIQFVNIKPEDKNRLVGFIEKHSEKIKI